MVLTWNLEHETTLSQARHETTSHRHAELTWNLEHETTLSQTTHETTSYRHAVLTWNLEQLVHMAQHGLRGPCDHRANGVILHAALRCQLLQSLFQTCSNK